MRRNIAIFMICVIFLLNGSCSWGIGLPEGKITLIVINEDGSPVEGADLGIGFERNTGAGTKKVPVGGQTDKEGKFTGYARTINYASYIVRKEGYYQSFGEYRFTKHEAGKWLPWNPEIKVVMRKIENPVPMYARNTGHVIPDIEIPAINKEIGFDLMECDWVAPYGTGKHADFIFKLEKRFKSRDDFDSTLTVTFANRFDGLQVVKENLKGGSMFKLPRYAPEDGYQKKVTHRKVGKGLGAPIDDYGDNTNYIFRVRSEEKDGKLYRAMYGKINGEIRFDPMNSKTAYIIFKYFLNPDYTRNLEYDGKNLFKDLKSFEQVGWDN